MSSGACSWMRCDPDGPSLAERRLAALELLAEQFTTTPPPELLRIFPHWPAELPQALRAHSAAELNAGLRGLEQVSPQPSQPAASPETAVAFQFAKNALRAALEVHHVLGETPPSHGHGDGPLECDLRAGDGAGQLVERLLAQTPAHIRRAFGDFDADLRALLGRPTSELRASIARLETVHGDLEVRRFTEIYPPARLTLEADAIGYTVHALHSLVAHRSAAAIGAAIAGACTGRTRRATSERPTHPTAEAQADEEPTSSSVRSFEFAALAEKPRAPPAAEAPFNPFNPCCDGVPLEMLHHVDSWPSGDTSGAQPGAQHSPIRRTRCSVSFDRHARSADLTRLSSDSRRTTSWPLPASHHLALANGLVGGGVAALGSIDRISSPPLPMDLERDASSAAPPLLLPGDQCHAAALSTAHLSTVSSTRWEELHAEAAGERERARVSTSTRPADGTERSATAMVGDIAEFL